MKTTRICFLLLAASFCLPIPALSQSNAHPDYYHARKNAEKYQKHRLKERRKQEKAQIKAAKAYHKHHQ